MTPSLLSFTRSWLRAVSLLLLLLGTSLLAQAQSNATPAIRYVRTDGTNASPAAATTWATSTTNLQGAINASAAGDQVWVATGTYKPGGNANTNPNIRFAMKNGVIIYGGFAATSNPTLTERNPASFPTVLSGDIGIIGDKADNSLSVIGNSNSLTATAVLDGFVIRDGNAGFYGGGMDNFKSSPTLTNCSFVNNSAGSGGGMFNFESSPTLTNCSFASNSAVTGGGISHNIGSSTLINCVLFGNGGANTFTKSLGTITVRYSLLEAEVGMYTNGGNNLTATTSPFLSPTDARLNACSPAINTGTNAANSTATDLAGNPRFVNTTIDRGAYEYQGQRNFPTAITQQLADLSGKHPQYSPQRERHGIVYLPVG